MDQRPKRGLGALLAATNQPYNASDAASVISTSEVPIHSVQPNPSQPRTHFDPAALEELTASIKERGLIQPIVVRPLRPEEVRGQAQYELIAGERRWRASQAAGLTNIPVVIKPVFDERDILLLSLVENLQRDDLNPIEEATAYANINLKFNLTHDQIAAGIGKSRAHISNLIRILELPSAILDALKSRKLSLGHAKVLLTIPDAKLQSHFAAKAQAENLSVRDLERLIVGSVLSPNPTEASQTSDATSPRRKGSRRTRTSSPQLQELEQRMREHFGTRVTIEEHLHKGRVIIEFYSAKDLERIVALTNLQ
jgi:ParB family chromosome partitioning protein